MKHNTLKRWVAKLPDVSAVMSRFPVPVALMAVFTLIIIAVDIRGLDNEIGRSLLGIILSAYLCVSFTLWREAHNKNKALIVQIGLSALVCALAWASESLRLNLLMALAAVLLLLGNSVRLRLARDDLHVWDFTHKLWTGAAFATLGSIIFLLGMLAIMAALKVLFGLDIEDLITDFILPVGFGFLAPLYWLSTLPPAHEDYSELYDNPGFVSKAVAFLGTWLLSPLTLIYAAILIAYAIKIVLAGVMPKGEIAALTTPFLMIGTLTWLVLEPPFIQDKLPAKFFRKSWFYVSIPAIIMLAIAVAVRVTEYGLTPERIALIFAVIWSGLLAVWFGFAPKDKRDIRLIPGLAAMLFALGFFVADGVSFANQKSRLMSGLKDADILDSSGKVKPVAQIKITDEIAARKAKGALRYVYRNNGETFLEHLMPVSKDEWSLSDLFEVTKLEDIEENNRYNSSSYFSYNSPDASIDITGFDRMTVGKRYYSKNNTGAKSPNTLYYHHDQNTLIFESDDIRTSFDLHAWAMELPTSGEEIIVSNPRVSIYEQGEHKIAIHVTRVNYYRRKGDESDISPNVEFYILSSGFDDIK